MVAWTVQQMPDQTGRTVVITGANSGIGYEAALAFAQKGAQVIMACRNMSKAEPARDQIRRQVPHATVELMTLDLGSLASIRAFADTFKANHVRLDLLINNAGLMAIPYTRTEDGFEMQFGVNHLSHFALTGLLLPLLLATETGRVVTVSSSFHLFGRIAFDNLDGTKRYFTWLAYGQSKLANLLFAYELQRRLAQIGSQVISVSCHPGYASTGLQSGGARMSGSTAGVWLSNLANSLFGQSAAMGALPTLYAATAPEVNGCDFIGPTEMFGMHGPPAKVQSNRQSYSAALATQLWEESERLTGVHYQAFSQAQ